VTVYELDPELFNPDPEPAVVRYTVISVDDHLVEPANTFVDRVPARFRDRAPRIIELPDGEQQWDFNGNRITQNGTNAMAGRRADRNFHEPFRFDQMRPGCYDVDARVHDMDLNGVWASMSFPSQVTGFCGRNMFVDDVEPELGAACLAAWNDWIYDDWFQKHPDRIMPLGIAYLADPAVAAAEIRRNAARGFVSISLPERPHLIGLPSLWDRAHWDPIIEACVETDTVISVHVGSTGTHIPPTDTPPLARRGLSVTLFGSLSLAAAAEWLWSEIPVRYPNVKIAMSEGGIGWVAMLLDRLDNIIDRSGYGKVWDDIRPADVFQRNFWFCTLDDPSTIDTRHRIGIDRIMVEVDYPHGDGTWPDTQDVIQQYWGHLPDDELRKICCENAAKLYRHPLPAVVLPAR